MKEFFKDVTLWTHDLPWTFKTILLIGLTLLLLLCFKKCAGYWAKPENTKKIWGLVIPMILIVAVAVFMCVA